MNEDLVCGVPVIDEGRKHFSEYNGDKYWFCSPECKRKFDDHPDHYIRQTARHES